MSTQLIDEDGECVAVRFAGGAGDGIQVSVRMPRSIAHKVAFTPVAEETSPDLRTTLGQWLEDQAFAGHTVRYVNDFGYKA